ncbi:hypothetical protein TKK_0007302 [Trichogramma kaykai]|uniref:DNA primase large subunit n=1 Tax=Trichogramma kaykai TaxID=54128 RepID=A0ABD2X951_9HYME
MDFTPSCKRRRTVKHEKNVLLELYPHDLQMYKVPPKGEIKLVEFQDLTLERQKVLQLLEIALAQQHKSLDELKQAFRNSLKKEGFHHYARLITAEGCSSHNDIDLEARRKDHISHFVMRLAYCLKAELQQKMLSLETELFKLRFSSLDKEGLTQFLATSGLHYTPVSKEFKDENRDKLITSTTKDGDFDSINFYEMSFHEVNELICDRRVFVKKGIAYVPQKDLISVFVQHFKNNLATELNIAKKSLMVNLEDDDRLQTFLKALPECYAGMSKVVWQSENTPISKLDDLSKTSYPLCMRVMHEHLKSTHHLRNTGRLQYQLFLKGIGVSLEDNIEFWRTELCKNPQLTDDKFSKEYLYQIRYNYGKLGRRVDYRPHGCNKLILDPVGAGEVHGCPYKHWDVDSLTKKLADCKIAPSDIGEITRLSKEGHYILACTKFFESSHKQMPGNMFMHPNAYYAESRKILNKDEFKGDETEASMLTEDMLVPISPEKLPPQPMKKNHNIPETNKSVTPRTAEKKIRSIDRKNKMDPLNIEALLNDDSD